MANEAVEKVAELERGKKPGVRLPPSRVVAFDRARPARSILVSLSTFRERGTFSTASTIALTREQQWREAPLL